MLRATMQRLGRCKAALDPASIVACLSVLSCRQAQDSRRQDLMCDKGRNAGSHAPVSGEGTDRVTVRAPLAGRLQRVLLLV